MSTGFTHEPPTGGSPEWYTPPWIFEAMKAPTFDLDPASPLDGPLPWILAKKHLTLREDGLASPWDEGAYVWLNPPYGRDIGKWTRKMAEHGCGLLLTFSRTETEWFHRDVLEADLVFFLDKRIHFVDRSGKPPVRFKEGKRLGNTPGSGSLLAAYGSRAVSMIETSTLTGAGWYL